MNRIKLLKTVYILLICLIFTYVPWQGRIPATVGNTKKTAVLECGYAWISSPPPGAKRINYRQLLAELVFVSIGAGFAYFYLKRRN